MHFFQLLLLYPPLWQLIILFPPSIHSQQKFIRQSRPKLSRNLGDTSVYYRPPQYNLTGPASNFIVGSYFQLTDESGDVFSVQYEAILAAICTMEAINTGRSDIKIRTQLSLYNYDLGGYGSRHVAATAMQLLAQDLYFLNGTESTEGKNIELGAIIGNGFIFEDYFQVFPLFTGYGIPVLTFGNSIEAPDTSAAVITRLQNYPQTYLLTAAASNPLSQAIISLLNYYNWSLVVPIFADDVFGFEGQTDLPSALIRANITTICGDLVADIRPNYTNPIVTKISNCLPKYSPNVIILWMGTDLAAQVATQLQKQSKVGYLTFVLALRVPDGPPVPLSALNNFVGSFFFQPLSVPRSTNNTLNRCMNETTAVDLIEKEPYFLRYWEFKFNCRFTGVNLTVCPHDLKRRTTACLCTGKESLADVPITYKVPFVSDTISVLATAISLLENNCTQLTEFSSRWRPRNSTNFCALKTFTPAILSEAIAYVRLEGLTGTVNFDQDANFRQIPALDLYQIRGNETAAIVGSFSNNLTIDSTKIIFPNNQIPISQLLVNNTNFWTQPIIAVFFALAIVGLVSTVLLAIYIWLHRKHRVIRKSSPVFCLLMLLGCFLIFLSLFFECFDYNITFCFLTTWCLVIGAGFLISNLLAKNYRIYRIFSNPRAVALFISDRDLLGICGVVVLGDLILLSVYSFVSGLLQPVIIISSSSKLYEYSQCQVPSSAIQTTFTILLYAYNIVLIIAAAVLAFLTRKVDTAYSESRYIAFVIYTYLMVAVIIIPLYYTTGDSVDNDLIKLILKAVAICLAMFVTLAVLFVPKVIETERFEKERKRKRQSDSLTIEPTTTLRQ